MKLISAIYNAPVRIVGYDENYVSVTIFYDGHDWTGLAYLHPDDKDFYSPRVGRRIATVRARIKIMRYEIEKMKKSITERELFYREVCGYGSKDYMQVDPSDSFRQNITRHKKRCEMLEQALKTEEENLKKYLNGQKKAITIIKNMRKNKEMDNNS